MNTTALYCITSKNKSPQFNINFLGFIKLFKTINPKIRKCINMRILTKDEKIKNRIVNQVM